MTKDRVIDVRNDQAEAEGDYEVGYGRPPVATRFQPGKSGNPKGRPRAIQRPSDLLRKALNRPVVAQVNGKPKRMTSLEFIISKRVAAAMSGDAKATEQILAAATRLELAEAEAPGTESAELSASDAEIMQALFDRHIDSTQSLKAAEAAPPAAAAPPEKASKAVEQ